MPSLPFPSVVLVFIALAGNTLRAGDAAPPSPPAVVPVTTVVSTAVAVPDELDALLAEVKPPARFGSHKPRLSVVEAEHTFAGKDGPEVWQFFFIKDGDRYIGYMPKTGFHGGTIYLLSHDPAEAVTAVPLPSERFHIDTARGAAFRTDHFLPDDNGSKLWNAKDQSAWTVEADGAELLLTRKFTGKHVFRKWEHSSPRGDKEGISVDHVSTFRLRCHPQLGYLIEAEWKTGLKPVITGQYVSLMPPSLSNPWEGDRLHQRVAICSDKVPGWIGHPNNHAAIARSNGADWILRDGGFATYLDRQRGWSWTQTLSGGPAPLAVCNVHADQDLCVGWPKNLVPAANGLTYHTVRVRQMRIPPELTNRVWDNMSLRLDKLPMVVLPLGKVCDFEDQPLTSATPIIGVTFTGMPTISTTIGHSGTRSMVVKGLAWPNLPQVVLKPKVRYRIEGWYKVEAASAAEIEAMKTGFVQKIERDRKAHAAKVAKAEKEGKPAPAPWQEPVWQEPGPAAASISADLYTWTPHNAGDFVLRQSTGEALAGAGSADQGWQKVWIEFDNPAWGPFVDVRFSCSNGGTAYLDDFCLRELGPATGAPTAFGPAAAAAKPEKTKE